MVEAHSVQDVPKVLGRKASGPPHGPHSVTALGEGRHDVWCLKCGLAGPECKHSLDAKLAFDERWH